MREAVLIGLVTILLAPPEAQRLQHVAQHVIRSMETLESLYLAVRRLHSTPGLLRKSLLKASVPFLVRVDYLFSLCFSSSLSPAVPFFLMVLLVPPPPPPATSYSRWEWEREFMGFLEACRERCAGGVCTFERQTRSQSVTIISFSCKGRMIERAREGLT